jgi:TrmH family RNA methyltransferase
MRLEYLSVAMMQPKFGLNVGYVARTMKNFGVSQLFIIGNGDLPRSAFRFASHGADIVRNARNTTLYDLRERFNLLVGTTAIVGGRGRNPARKTISLEKAASLGFDPKGAVIVLGRDTTGLTAEELRMCDVVIHLRTGTSYPTLNISHALAIVLYGLSAPELTGIYQVDRVYRDKLLEVFSTALRLGMYPERKRGLAIKTLDQAVMRSGITQEEVMALIGVFRKMNLALEKRF